MLCGATLILSHSWFRLQYSWSLNYGFELHWSVENLNVNRPQSSQFRVARGSPVTERVLMQRHCENSGKGSTLWGMTGIKLVLCLSKNSVWSRPFYYKRMNFTSNWLASLDKNLGKDSKGITIFLQGCLLFLERQVSILSPSRPVHQVLWGCWGCAAFSLFSKKIT